MDLYFYIHYFICVVKFFFLILLFIVLKNWQKRNKILLSTNKLVLRCS